MSRPHLVLVGGSIANGKSTLCQFLRGKLGLPYVAVDTLKESVFDLVGCRDRQWSSEVGKAMFPVFQQLVEMHLSRGESVLAEAVFYWPQDADWIASIAAKYNAQPILIWLTADPAVARARFIDRGVNGYHPGHCHTTADVLSEFDEKYFSRRLDPVNVEGPTLVVDTTDFTKVNYDEIAAFIQSSRS